MRPLAVVLGLAFALLSGFSVEAAPKDAEARRMISRAMDQFAADKDGDKASQELMGTIGTCATDCEPRLVALAWMYIGLVSGTSNDYDTAREAFTVALGFDPTLTLDARFATPTTQALFDGIKAKAAAPQPAAPAPDKFVAGTQLSCTPLLREVQSLRPVPVSCKTKMTNVGQIVVLYRQYGSENWARKQLAQKGGRWEGEIPCTDLPRPGVWGMYFEARDKRGELLDALGSTERPVVFKVVAESSEPPPSLPGLPAPDRCNPSSYCPEDMVGTPACDAFMSGGNAPSKPPTCSKDNACEWGMECRDGSCELAGLCSKNSDCDRGSLCTDGRCALDRTKPVLPPEESGFRDWLGLHVAADFTSLSGASDVCVEGGGYTCYSEGEEYRGTPNDGNAGDVAGGFHSSTLRVLLTYERFVTNEISLGGRFGFAFGGAPDGFFPLHFEARGTYYFGDVPNGTSLFVPFVALGVGAAQIDSKASVSLVDCNAGQEQICQNAPLNTGLVDPDTGVARVRTLDAYKSLGSAFVVLSPGVRFALQDNLAAIGNLGLLLMTEEEQSSGVFLSLQPSVGVALGF
jgi:hypothetical protein